LVNVFIEVVPYSECLQPLGVHLDKLVINILMDIDAGSCVASLAIVHFDARSRPFDGLIDTCIL
jgi:hypothetical protein